jgi:hypothetical protein
MRIHFNNLEIYIIQFFHVYSWGCGNKNTWLNLATCQREKSRIIFFQTLPYIGNM